MVRTRVKSQPVFKDWFGVDDALRQVAACEIEIEQLTIDAEKQIAGIRAILGEELKPHLNEKAKLVKDIESFVADHKEDLVGKSKIMNFGSVGYRYSTSVVLPKGKEKIDELIRKLKLMKMADCLNVKETVIKDVLKKYGEEVVYEVGAKLKKDDGFWYDTVREKPKV